MNNHDQQNIEFILAIAKDTQRLSAWFQSVEESGDEQEIAYAMNMLLAAQSHCEIELLELLDFQADRDLAQAASYLQRFRLQ